VKYIYTLNNKIVILNGIISKFVEDEIIYKLRDVGPSGGLIFYVNENYLTDGWRYLESAPITGDTVATKYSNVNSLIGTTGTVVGTGSGNTWSILNQSGYTGVSVTKYCDDYSVNGFFDWFLPSQDELDWMYKNLYLYNVGDLSSASYWSSSEVSSTHSYRQSFTTGLQSSSTKSTSYRYRPIRKFLHAKNYTVTYNGNGYTSGTVPDSEIHIEGTTIIVSGTGNLIHYDDSFFCWNSQSDGYGVDYLTGSTFILSNNITLYAKWLTYTIAFLPDTQSYVKYKEEVVTSQIDWLINNKDNINLKFVGHEGDIVQDHESVLSQWEFMQSEMFKLTGSSITFSTLPGNHDYVENTRTNTTLNEFFPLLAFSGMTTYGGSYDSDSDNTYHVVNINGNNLLILSLEFGPRDVVVEWANDILEIYSNTKTILLTHAYLRSNGELLTHSDNHAASNGYGLGSGPPDVNDGDDLWEKIVYPNNNIFFVVSGHDGEVDIGSALRVSGHSDGSQIIQIMSNFQYYPSFPGYFVLLRFSSTQISFRTYSPYLNQYKNDDYSQGDWNWSW
jgi:hypothetical protein